jgi:hypothetical protein
MMRFKIILYYLKNSVCFKYIPNIYAFALEFLERLARHTGP